jgi:hypothetical protein
MLVDLRAIVHGGVKKNFHPCQKLNPRQPDITVLSKYFEE